MKKRKKILLFLCFLVIDLLFVGCFFFFLHQTNLNRFRKEMNVLSLLDITKDRYNLKIKSRGKYRIVEKAIKDYLDAYALEYQDLSKMVSDEKLLQLLSYENYEKDGPNFEESTNYLNSFHNHYLMRIDSLLSNLEEDTIKNHINQYTKDSYCKKLYNEYMSQDDLFGDLLATKELLINARSRVNSFYQVHLEIFDFLKNHSDSWSLHDGEIEFVNNDLYDQYQGLLNKIPKA